MIKRVSSSHIIGIDALRGLAIILMFITHGGRLYNGKHDDGILNQILNFFSSIEPFTSSLFLFLVGVGLFLSHQNTKLSYGQWLKKTLVKAGQLYLIGVIFFFMEYGPQFPEMLLSPNILSVIAFSIIAVSLSLSYPILLLGTGLSIATISYMFEGAATPGINTGPGGAFPLMLFTFLGYLTYQFSQTKNSLYTWLLATGIISWFYPFSPLEHWTYTYPSIYDYFVTGQTALDFFQNGGFIDGYSKTGFWSHSVISVLRLLIPLSLCLWVCMKSNEFINSSKIGQNLALLGRHALGLYILHLIIIAALYTGGFKPQSALIDWFLIIGLVVIGLAYGKLKERP